MRQSTASLGSFIPSNTFRSSPHCVSERVEHAKHETPTLSARPLVLMISSALSSARDLKVKCLSVVYGL